MELLGLENAARFEILSRCVMHARDRIVCTQEEEYQQKKRHLSEQFFNMCISKKSSSTGALGHALGRMTGASANGVDFGKHMSVLSVQNHEKTLVSMCICALHKSNLETGLVDVSIEGRCDDRCRCCRHALQLLEWSRVRGCLVQLLLRFHPAM